MRYPKSRLEQLRSQIEINMGNNTIKTVGLSKRKSAAMKAWQWLGYLGLLPFILSLAASLFIQDWHDKAVQIFIFYSAIILSFLAGSLWRVKAAGNNNKHLAVSNLFSLIAFTALLMPTLISLMVLAIGFLSLFYYESFMKRNNDKKAAYLKMRFNLTSLVVLLHATALYFWTTL
jgi:Protein of unknown function (DUF3429)